MMPIDTADDLQRADHDPGNRDAALKVVEMVNSSWMTQAISVAAWLGIPDLLANGPKSSQEIAAANAHPHSLRRLCGRWSRWKSSVRVRTTCTRLPQQAMSFAVMLPCPCARGRLTGDNINGLSGSTCLKVSNPGGAFERLSREQKDLSIWSVTRTWPPFSIRRCSNSPGSLPGGSSRHTTSQRWSASPTSGAAAESC